MEEENDMPMSQPFGAPHAEAGALQYQLEGIDTVERIERIIKGEVEVMNNNTKAVEWVQRFKPMVNSRGLNMIRGYLTMYLGGTKTYALTDLGEEYISDEVIDIGHNIKAELMDNWTEYSVKDYSSASFIINIITSAVNAVLRKGQNATYLKFLRTTQSIQEVQHHQTMGQRQQPKENDGIMGMLFNKKKRGY